MTRTLLLVAVLALSGCLCGALAQAKDKKAGPVGGTLSTVPEAPTSSEIAMSASSEYVPVTKYDPSRNAAQDISDAVDEAKRTGRRVLIEVGGEWCSWCHRMDAFFEKNPDLLAMREKNFVMVKVNYSDENKNEAVLGAYPKVAGYPHIFVLERDGSLLFSQDTGELEEGKGYNLQKFMAFLMKWAPQAKQS